MSWNSLCRPGWPGIQKSSSLCLSSAGIKDVHHHLPAPTRNSKLQFPTSHNGLNEPQGFVLFKTGCALCALDCTGRILYRLGWFWTQVLASKACITYAQPRLFVISAWFFNPKTQKVEAEGSLHSFPEVSLVYIEFQDSQGYLVRSFLRSTK